MTAQRDGRGQVAVGDELDARARGPDLGNQLLVTRPIEADDRQVRDLAPESVSDASQVLGYGLPDIDVARGNRTDAQLVEIRVGRVEKAALLGRGQHGDRVGQAHGDEIGALERIDSDVDLRLAGHRRCPRARR